MLGRITIAIRTRHILGSVWCVLFLYGAMRVMRAVHGYVYSETITVIVPSWATDACKKHIESFCKKENMFSFASFVSYLRSECPYLSGIDIVYQHTGIELSVDLADPLFLVNKEYLLLANNTIIPCSWYQIWRWKDIPQLTLVSFEKEKTLPVSEFEMIKKFQHFLMSEDITCVWIDKTDIRFFIADMPEWTIRCSGYTVPDEKLMRECRMLYRIFLAEKGKKKKKKQYYLCDIRFEKQIVLYADKEGGFDGFIVNA